MKYILSCLIYITCQLAHAQQVQLLSQDGFAVLSESSKIDSSKKHDTWKITITVTTPAEDTYFITKKTGNILTDIYLDRFVKIAVTNHAGIFASGDKYIKAESANFVTTGNNAIYVIKSDPYQETFNVEIPSGARPNLQASFIPTFTPLNDIPILKANDAELFAGTSPYSRRFLIYERQDTLLPPRKDNALQLLDEKHKPMTVTYSYDKFHVIGNNKLLKDTLLTAITYLDWENSKMSARITENNFETSKKGDFSDVVAVHELHIKDANGNNQIISLEKLQKNILILGNTYHSDYTCTAANGEYSLNVRQDGNLVLTHTADGHIVWINNMPAKVMFSTIWSPEKFTVSIAGLSANIGHDNTRPAYLSVTNEGNLILYRRDGLAMWQSNAAGR